MFQFIMSERALPDSGRPWKLRYGPDGVHFFDRTTGLNVLVDEIELPADAWSRAPRTASIALTNACDLACPHCYAPKMRGLLRFEDVCSWLRELDCHGCLGVGFGGGEPTLFPQFAELCEFSERETGMAVTFTTHAHHLTPELAERLRGTVHYIRVSMDGVGATYERLRGRSFAAFCDRIARVSSITHFGVNFVVNAQTFRDLEEAVSIARAHGATEFLLLPERATNHVAGIDPETMAALRSWIAGYPGPMRLAISINGAEGLPICTPTPLECGPRSYLHIDAMGALKHSSFDSQGVEIGKAGLIAAIDALIAKEALA